MIVLLLTDGSQVEIPEVTNVIHRGRQLICLNGEEALLMVEAGEVFAYTIDRRPPAEVDVDRRRGEPAAS